MKEKKFFLREPKYTAFFLAALALILFIIASVTPRKKFPALFVVFTIFSIIALVAGGVFLYISHRIDKSTVNIFLYDRRRKKKLPVSALTGESVRDSMNFYLSKYVESPSELWEGFPKPLMMDLQAYPIFSVPIAYDMLYELSAIDKKSALALFAGADERLVASVCRAVKKGNDGELADFIFNLKQNVNDYPHRAETFFQKNQRVFEGRLLRYIKEHAHEFTVKK